MRAGGGGVGAGAWGCAASPSWASLVPVTSRQKQGKQKEEEKVPISKWRR